MSKLSENTETLQKILDAANNLPDAAGSAESKLPSVIDKTVTEITAADLEGATQIGANTFYLCYELKSVVIPNGVTKIGVNAFNNCLALESVSIPNSVTSIGNSAFSTCSSMANINIPSSVTEIGSGAFNNCYALPNITIPDGVTHIQNGTFYGCSNISNFTIPSSVINIGSQAFYGCRKMEYIDLTTYGISTAFPTLSSTNAFSSAGANTAAGTFEIRVIAGRKAELAAMTNWNTYASNIVEISNSAGDALPPSEGLAYTLVDGNTYGVSEGEAMDIHIVIPSTYEGVAVTKIMDSGFSASSIQGVYIPASITHIGMEAFTDCFELEYVDMQAFVTESFPVLEGDTVFSDMFGEPLGAQIRVAPGRKNELAAMTNWSLYADYIVEVNSGGAE